MDTSRLYTGINSTTLNKENDIRKEAKDVKKAKQTQLKPSVKIFIAEIDKEIEILRKKDYKKIKELVSSGVPNALEIDLLAEEKAIERFTNLRARITNIMRVK